jgi:hypothetical protein
MDSLPDTTQMQPRCSSPTGAKRPRHGRLLTLDDLDRRTRAYQRATGLRDQLIEDLGGAAQVSIAQRELAERTAVTSAMLVDFEARWLSGEPIDVNAYFTGQNAQRRNLQTLGLERRHKDVTPSLARFINAIPEPLAAPYRANEPEEAFILPEEPAAIPEPLQHALGVIPAGVTDGEPGTVISPGFPLAEPEPMPGQRYQVEDSRGFLVYSPRSDGEPRYAIIDADGSLMGYAMSRAEGERLALKLRPMRLL